MRPVVTTSWDDGDPLDLKLAETLSEYGIRGTFYHSTHNCERAVMALADVRRLSERFEIGGHSLTHPDLRKLGPQGLHREIRDGKRELEDALGKSTDMFCYPKGRYNARVRQAVVDAGYLGARTTRTFLFDLPRDPWLMPTTLWARDFPWWFWYPHCLRSRSWPGLKELVCRGVGKPWWELAHVLLDHVLAHGGVWHLWGHSWEIEERGLWTDLRKLFERVGGRDDVVYATNGEVVRMAAAYRG